MAVDPLIVAGRVGKNPTLAAHASLVRSRRRHAHGIAPTRQAGGAQIGIGLSRMDGRPIRRICLRGAGEQHRDANNKKTSHDRSFPAHAHM